MPKKIYITLLVLLSIIILLWRLGVIFIFDRYFFDREVWIRENISKTDECYRGEMAGDVMRNVVTAGMSKKQVLDVLGEPDKMYEYEYEYILGMCSFIDFDVMYIYFDRNNKVITTKIRQT